MDDFSESAVRAARDVRVAFSRFRRRLKDLGNSDEITAPQTSVLIRLAKHGPASANELAGAEQVRPQSMSATLAGLDRHGLIARHVDPLDGRRRVITLTREGRECAESNRQVRDEWLVRAMQERYSEKERQTILAALALLDRLTDQRLGEHQPSCEHSNPFVGGGQLVGLREAPEREAYSSRSVRPQRG